MESLEFLTPSQNDESNPKTSLTFDSQPKFDSLLDKLRKGMSELTSKGDDFTKQMWNMYNTLEDIIISSKMNDNQNIDNTLLAINNSKAKPLPIISISDDKTYSQSVLHSMNSLTIDSNNINFTDFLDSHSIEIELNNCKNSNKLSEDSLLSKQNEENNQLLISESIINRNEFMSHIVSDCEQDSNEESINTITHNKSKNNLFVSKSNAMSDKSEKVSKLLCSEKFGKNDGFVKRVNSNEHIVNPLLDTINTLTSCSDSSDECEINKKCYTNRVCGQRRLLNSNRHSKRKSSNYYYSSSDGDSVSGYTGSNSLESGYKSDFLGENTPEIIDGSSLSSFGTAVDCVEQTLGSHSEGISHQISDNDSNNGKQSIVNSSNTSSTTKTSFDINSGLNNNSNKNSVKNEKQKNDDLCSDNISADSITKNCSSNRKTVGMFSEKIANRLKAFNNDSQLDHLLKLRKSLLKALKRCEQISSPVNSRDGSPVISSRSSSPASTVVKSPLTSNTNNNLRRMREDSNSTDKIKSKLVSSPLTLRPDEMSHQQNALNNCCMASNISTLDNSSNCINNNSNNSNNSKSVRFNSSVKISPINSLQHNRQHINSNYASNYTVNKSILKDPLCETLCSSIKAGEFRNDCSLEGEIDTLLYGRTGGYYYSPQLEGSGHLDDSPSSTYVSMIEEKYRTYSGNSSASKQSPALSSKKSSKDYSSLKTGFSSSMSSVSSVLKPHELDLDLITTSELRINATLSTTMSRPKSNPYSIYGNSVTIGNKTNRKSTKSHFTEMAKCMLEILDDLQVPQNNVTNERQNILDDTTHIPNKLHKKSTETESIDLLMKELSRGQSETSDISDISSISYRTLPEHHIYEEILYDCLESQPQQYKYLHYTPRRAFTSISSTNTFSHSSVNSIRVDAPIHQSRNISPDIKHSNRQVGSWGRTSNKPKQRSNLYSLFADEMERRNISRSLEREYCKRKTNDVNDSINVQNDNNYGFKASL